MQVFLNEQEIEQVKETIVLGVFLNENLSWKAHISQTNKISKSIGINSRSSFFSQKSHIKANAYKTLVRPQIEYASTTYGILSPKRTKIKLRWYREELPALFATTTDAKQASLPCLMSLAGAVSSSEEQTKD